MGSFFWAILVVFFLFTETIINSFITIWFAISSLVLLLISNKIQDYKIEFFIFLVLSLILIIIMQPILKKYYNKINKFNSKTLNGKVKIVNIISINGIKEYEVKFKGTIWSAISEEEFQIGEKAEIESFKGNKIILKK